MDNLVNGISEAQQFGAVNGCAATDLRGRRRPLWCGHITGVCRLLKTKGIDELLQE
jgi:hypothetical protein